MAELQNENTIYELGPLGQMPTCHAYPVFCLGFSVDTESTDALQNCQARLRKGASELCSLFPWLMGQVVNVEPPDTEKDKDSGHYRVIRMPEHEGPDRFIHYKDCKSLMPDYTIINEARAPVHMLPASIISATSGYSTIVPSAIPMPVIAVQANILKGGLILNFSVSHNVMDGTGTGTFIQYFAALCRGEKLDPEEVRWGNIDRLNIVPEPELPEPHPDMQKYRLPHSALTKKGFEGANWPPVVPETGQRRWRAYRITAPNLKALKAEASKHCSPETVPYVSTDDAITALIWSRIAAVRHKRNPDMKQTRIGRCVDGRSKLKQPLPNTYLGHVLMVSYSDLPLPDDDLSSVATLLRKDLRSVDDHHVRSFVHILRTEADRTTMSYQGPVDPKVGIMQPSFMGTRLNHANFGPELGYPDWTRRPYTAPSAGMCYIFPYTRQGDVDVIFGLPDEDLNGVEADEIFRRYAEVIG